MCSYRLWYTFSLQITFGSWMFSNWPLSCKGPRSALSTVDPNTWSFVDCFCSWVVCWKVLKWDVLPDFVIVLCCKYWQLFFSVFTDLCWAMVWVPRLDGNECGSWAIWGMRWACGAKSWIVLAWALCWPFSSAGARLRCFVSCGPYGA